MEERSNNMINNNIINLKGVIRRGRKAFLIPFVLVLLLAIVTAFALPPVYLSKAKILIEGQQIPDGYVESTVTSYVEERLEMITQQIMSRANLLNIINKFGLFSDMRDRYTTEDIIEKVRDHIKMETIIADVTNKRSGRPSPATIAFTVSYEGKNPAVVQKVANELASLYLEQNLATREKSASNTTAFFQDQLDSLKKQIESLEERISRFKEKHIGELPEYSAINMQAINRLNRDLSNIDMQIRSLEERKVYLEGQLSSVEPLSPVVTENGKTMMNPAERLKYLRLELIRLQSVLSDRHPDVKNIKREIKELEATVGKTDESALEIKRLKDLEGKLAKMKGTLGPKHPDVIALTKEVEILSEKVRTGETRSAASAIAEEEPDNPAFINLKTQVASAELELQSLQREKERIRQEMAKYEQRIDNAPVVEMEYSKMTRDYNNAKAAYDELMSKLMAAKVAQGMEETQRGERFTIIDPAQFPERPYKPNRIAIMLIGFVLALGAGVGLAALRESMDMSVKSREELYELTGAPVLSTISMMETEEERRARLFKRAAFSLAGLGVMAVTLILVHIYVMPLDILWIKIQHRITLRMGV